MSIRTPDRHGRLADIVLGFDDLDGYLTRSRYFGAVVGRYGNRIAKGRFTLDGRTFQLATNNGANHLHGGVQGVRQGGVAGASRSRATATPRVALQLHQPRRRRGISGHAERDA